MKSYSDIWLATDLKCQIMKVICGFTDDPNYTKEEAVKDLLQVVEALEMEAQISNTKIRL